MRITLKKILAIFIFFPTNCCAELILPKISIITSVFKGDLFIEEFMKNITSQTIFSQCELIIINANSPEHEEEVITKYKKQFSNIRYIKLIKDPGLYAVWNLAINISNGRYIINANLDDRLKSDAFEVFSNTLDNDDSVDLVYGDIYFSQIVNTKLENPQALAVSHFNEFSKENMIVCMPMNHPMWRKSMHEKYGFFDDQYGTAADYEMWLRAVDKNAKFKKIQGVYSIFYSNPKGLSYNNVSHEEQVKKILFRYRHLFKMHEKTTDQIYEIYLRSAVAAFTFL